MIALVGLSRAARCRGSSSGRSAARRSCCATSRPAGSTASSIPTPNLAPWDYLGGYLACVEAGAIVRDANGDELVTDDPDARRQLIAAGTPELADALDAGERAAHDDSISTRCSSPPTRPRAPAARSCARTSASPPDVREKAPGDWVTAADIASEDAVRAVLERETDLPVFGEEAGGERADIGWLVDPLDGTANFVHGLDAVGVSVGLVVDGEPVVGVVHAPLLDRTYAARKGGGAFRDERRIHVSSRATRAGDRRDRVPVPAQGAAGRGTSPRSTAALHRFEDLRRVGAASLDLCWTAEGVFDGYFELRLGPWDVAAGAIIVREAGGVVTDWDGDPAAWLVERQHPGRPARGARGAGRDRLSSGLSPSIGPTPG